jgi:hypothetical protein
MPYAVIIDNLVGRDEDPELPKVVAHNLTREAAGRKESEFRSLSSVGVAAAIWEYDTPHSEGEPEDCDGCTEIVLEHSRYKLKIVEQEAARRGQQILQKNMGDKQADQG